MKLEYFNTHLANVILKKHNGNKTAAAGDLGISFSTMKRMSLSLEQEQSDNPLYDATVLVEILREYMPQLCGDDRVLIHQMLTDGYCLTCGSDFKCSCPRQL